MERLDDSDTGGWEVFTETSTYLVDLEKGRMIRYPGAAADPHVADGGVIVGVNDLVDDTAWVPLILLAQCQVGASLIAFTGTGDEQAGESDGIWRTSTLITAIRRVDDQRRAQSKKHPDRGQTQPAGHESDARRDS
jgi:hypothetical protein